MTLLKTASNFLEKSYASLYQSARYAPYRHRDEHGVWWFDLSRYRDDWAAHLIARDEIPRLIEAILAKGITKNSLTRALPLRGTVSGFTARSLIAQEVAPQLETSADVLRDLQYLSLHSHDLVSPAPTAIQQITATIRAASKRRIAQAVTEVDPSITISASTIQQSMGGHSVLSPSAAPRVEAALRVIAADPGAWLSDRPRAGGGGGGIIDPYWLTRGDTRVTRRGSSMCAGVSA